MPNDTAITRLLYAILSQKCLKDIDWNRVAHDPVLSQEITNGHAARMRYSRFKKQMDGTANTPTRRRAPKGSKNKVEKSPRKGKGKGKEGGKGGESEDDEAETEEGVGVKREPSLPSMLTPLSTTDFPTPNSYLKTEYDSPNPHTYHQPSHTQLHRQNSPTPSPSPQTYHSQSHRSHQTQSQDLDPYISSFTSSLPGLPSPSLFGEYGMGIDGSYGAGGYDLFSSPAAPSEFGESFEGSGIKREEGEGVGVAVKREERWEEGYRGM